MKYLKKINESDKISIFNSDWVKMLPKDLTIVTNNGEFTYQDLMIWMKQVTLLMVIIQ